MNSPVLYHPVLGQYVVLAEDRRGRSFKLLELRKTYFTPQDINKLAQQWSKLATLSHLSTDDIVTHIKEISQATIPATPQEVERLKEDVVEVKESCTAFNGLVSDLAKEVDLLKLVVQQREEIERLRAQVRAFEQESAQVVVAEPQRDGGSTDETIVGWDESENKVADESFVTAQMSCCN